ncbi:MAG: DUF4019 domain-containing protein [Acidobacteriota bacterium]
MKRWLAAALITVLLVVPLMAAAPSAEKSETSAAVKSARAWLALVDQGKYAQSWKQASDLVQKAVTQEKWETAMAGARKSLGKLEKRMLGSAHEAKDLPGAPAGDYVIIRFLANFEHKKAAVETVTMQKQPDGTWRAAGYFIK